MDISGLPYVTSVQNCDILGDLAFAPHVLEYWDQSISYKKIGYTTARV